MVLLILVSCLPVAADNDTDVTHILYLNSYDYRMNWPESILRGIESVLDEEDRHFNLHYEALDSKEFSVDKFSEEFARYLGVKYAGYDFSLILSSDNNALEFLKATQEDLFPAVPVVFCGINDFDQSMIEGYDDFTGIMEVSSAVETVNLMLSLHPGTEEIFVINDYLVTGRAWKNQIETGLDKLDLPVKITHSENLSLEELQQEIASLPDTSLILSGAFFADRDGFFTTYENMAEKIASASRVPFYTLVDFNVQKGVIGGKVVSGFVHGETIARIGLRILDGESPADIPVGDEEFNQYLFNYPELERFGISLKDLPEDSVIINRPFSLYESYTLEIWLIILIILFLSAATVILLIILEQRKQSEKTLKQFSDATWEGIIIHNQGITVQTNRMFTQIFGFSRKEMEGSHFVEKIIAPSFRDRVQDRIASGNTAPYEALGLRKDGIHIPVEIRVRNIHINGKPYRFAAIRDLSDKKKAEQEFADLQSLWDRMFENSLEAIFIMGADGRIERVNKSYKKISGYSGEEIVGQNVSTFYSEFFTRKTLQEMSETIREKGEWSGELLSRRKSGEVYSLWLHLFYLMGETPEDRKTIGIFTDISEKKRQEEELNWMSKYDALTGFSNRTLFLDILGSELKTSERSGEICAVMILNLDGLKHINNSYGFLSGDELIRKFSERLTSGIRDEDLVSRFGGDDFAVLAPRLTDKNQVDIVLKRILDLFSTPIALKDHSVNLSVSIGVSLYPFDGTSEKDLIVKAETALKRTKANRKGSYSYFNSEQDKAVLFRSELEMHLRKSILRDELDVFYQPKINPRTNRISGFEGLVRWQRNHSEWIPPDVFIPISEDNGFIMDIGEFVLGRACDFILKLQEQGYDDFHVGINISAKQFSNHSFIENFIQTVESRQIEPRFLDLEVTESITASKIYNAIESLSRLQEYGFSISIDDFGTGYSSLQYLLNLPFDTMKIDKSFIDQILADENHLTVLDTMISLAHSLKKKIVAEGAETSRQIEYLADHGCELIQGYYYSRPLPETDILEWIKDKM
ncbi:MAG: EAL domain-containing protein [Spirochaetales bacterium]|nr:EAL domain-containing protein [Spirochaetales bacterium]